MTTVLELAWQVCDDVGMGMTRPTTLFGVYNEGDTNDLKLKRAITKCARFLRDYWDWPVITAEWEFVTVDGKPQPLAIPPDFKKLIKDSMVDTVHRRRVQVVDRLPVMPLETFGIAPLVTIRGKSLELWSRNPPEARIVYSYVRDAICRSSPAIVMLPGDGATCSICAGEHGPADALKPNFTCDRDELLWDDELMHLGTVWALSGRDGSASQEDYQAFLGRLQEMTNHEAGDGVLNMGGENYSDPAAWDDTNNLPRWR
jgi:hypothetical protein